MPLGLGVRLTKGTSVVRIWFVLTAAGLFSASAAALAAAPEQFDLACTGTTSFTSIGDTHQEPFNALYHVDLEAKKWCEDGCGAIYDIYSVQPAMIELKAPRHEPHPDGDEIDEGFINRETGHYQALRSTGQGLNIMMWETKGTCTPAPFSGFPKVQTKF